MNALLDSITENGDPLYNVNIKESIEKLFYQIVEKENMPRIIEKLKHLARLKNNYFSHDNNFDD